MFCGTTCHRNKKTDHYSILDYRKDISPSLMFLALTSTVKRIDANTRLFFFFDKFRFYSVGPFHPLPFWKQKKVNYFLKIVENMLTDQASTSQVLHRVFGTKGLRRHSIQYITSPSSPLQPTQACVCSCVDRCRYTSGAHACKCMDMCVHIHTYRGGLRTASSVVP